MREEAGVTGGHRDLVYVLRTKVRFLTRDKGHEFCQKVFTDVLSVGEESKNKELLWRVRRSGPVGQL